MKVLGIFFLGAAFHAFGNLSQYKGKFSALNEENLLKEFIQEIEKNNTINKFYVDIGAGDGVTMSNTARLALNGWRGLAIEADEKKRAAFLQHYKNSQSITFKQSKVTPCNVGDLLRSQNVPYNFGILSLDIDGYDYFVLEALLKEYRPAIIVTEINEKIPPPLEFTVLFHANYSWNCDHFYGQSISQLKKLAASTGYSLVYLEYNNAFLICSEMCSRKDLTAKEAYLAGYQNNSNRKALFPWNSNVDHLLTGSPDENYAFLNHFFEKYKGKYLLNKGTD